MPFPSHTFLRQLLPSPPSHLLPVSVCSVQRARRLSGCLAGEKKTQCKAKQRRSALLTGRSSPPQPTPQLLLVPPFPLPPAIPFSSPPVRPPPQSAEAEPTKSRVLRRPTPPPLVPSASPPRMRNAASRPRPSLERRHSRKTMRGGWTATPPRVQVQVGGGARPLSGGVRGGAGGRGGAEVETEHAGGQGAHEGAGGDGAVGRQIAVGG